MTALKRHCHHRIKSCFLWTAPEVFLCQHTSIESCKNGHCKEPVEVSSPASCLKHIQVQNDSKLPRARQAHFEVLREQISQPLWAACPSTDNCCYLPTQSPAHSSASLCSITGAEHCMCSCWNYWGSFWSVPVVQPKSFLNDSSTLELSTCPFNIC